MRTQERLLLRTQGPSPQCPNHRRQSFVSSRGEEEEDTYDYNSSHTPPHRLAQVSAPRHVTQTPQAAVPKYEKTHDGNFARKQHSDVKAPAPIQRLQKSFNQMNYTMHTQGIPGEAPSEKQQRQLGCQRSLQ